MRSDGGDFEGMNPPVAAGAGGAARVSAGKRELPTGVRLRFCEVRFR